MTKTVLWIDDSAEERAVGGSILADLEGVVPEFASSSVEARRILETRHVDAIVTDILRRNPDRSIARDDGYDFFQEYIRPTFSKVRRVYGIADSVKPDRPNRIVHGGIITSSRFTTDAEEFKRTLRRRPLLRDGQWLREQLEEHAPRVRDRKRQSAAGGLTFAQLICCNRAVELHSTFPTTISVHQSNTA